MQSAVLTQYETDAAAHELSRVIRLDEITAIAATMTLDAGARDCAALAARFELPYVRNLSATSPKS